MTSKSFIKQALSMESVHDSTVSLEELEREVAEASSEFDNAINERNMAEDVVREVETQNELIEQHVNEGGEITEIDAALIETNRRTAAAALNIDPDSDEAAELIDQPGLEAMVNNRGVLALEESKNFLSKVKDGIVAASRAAIEALKKFFITIARIFTNRHTKVYAMSAKFLSIKDVDAVMKKCSDEELKDKHHGCLLFEPGTTNVVKAEYLFDNLNEVFTIWERNAESSFKPKSAMPEETMFKFVDGIYGYDKFTFEKGYPLKYSKDSALRTVDGKPFKDSNGLIILAKYFSSSKFTSLEKKFAKTFYRIDGHIEKLKNVKAPNPVNEQFNPWFKDQLAALKALKEMIYDADKVVGAAFNLMSLVIDKSKNTDEVKTSSSTAVATA